jgi:hypothetical protein
MGGYSYNVYPAMHIQPMESPIQQYSQIMSLKHLQQAGELQGLQIRQAQQQLKDQEATTAAARSWDGQDYDALAKSVLQNGGSATAAFAIQQHGLGIKKTVSDIARSDSETGSKNLETFIGRQKAIGDHLQGIEGVPDEQLHQKALDTINALMQNRILDPKYCPTVCPTGARHCRSEGLAQSD